MIALFQVPASVPVDPDRQQARRWALDELSRKEYQDARPSLIERALQWIQDRFGDIRPDFDSPVQITVAILAAVLVAVIAFAVWRSGGVRRQYRRRAAAVLPGRVTTAADHREAADRHAAAGRWDEAVLERFRAVARELDERALVAASPGATASEVAGSGGRALPQLADELHTAARHFDDVCYGHLNLADEAGRETDAFLRRLDEQVRTARTTPVLPVTVGRP
ncbi:DUF4129 domain-containing protein [Kineosporia sp. J2-2]|uniref:DUF4129 domain-containing protein n=1 Tax=Kineosporia corallincola TaxID=2835133 RepID=A0ABS5TL53_9ACTN|nr:DUF4129 domain-containing protein [Kineosporia corallincola]MBT0770319.1 DUF4129 domain-containing protein [Kineosporia corallincola]